MSSSDLAHAAEIIRAGGVVAYPTEAVFGLGCDPRDEMAVDKLLVLKNRAREKGLILIAADFRQLESFLKPLDNAATQCVMRTWPGPVTWLIPAKSATPVWLRGDSDKLAVRVTAHPIAAELCRRAGRAIVSTSANVSGQAPARSADATRRMFGAEIDFVLDGPLGDSDKPTEIRDAITGAVVRSG